MLTARGTMRHRCSENYLQYLPRHVSTRVHLCLCRRPAVQGIQSTSSSSLCLSGILYVPVVRKFRRKSSIGPGCNSGHFEGERVGTPFPLLKFPWNAWERRSPC